MRTACQKPEPHDGDSVRWDLLASGASLAGYGWFFRQDPGWGAFGLITLGSFDGNGDGAPAHYVTFAGWSTLGIVNGGLMVEYDFPNIGPDAACPTGTLRLPILASASNRALTVRALRVPAGQFFMRDDAATALFCLDPSMGAFTMSLKGTFEGGLGLFEGASGEYEYKGSGQVLLQDAAGLPFGGFELKTEGTIILP